MLIAVKSCDAHWDRCSAIRDTWWTPIVHFLTGNELNIPDSYEALPLKTRAICKWAVTRGFLWATLVDTDTYVSVPRLTAETWGDYTGYRLEEKDYASGGAGYVLSRRAMMAIAHCDAEAYKAEDEMVGKVLKNAGINLVHDPRFSLYEDVLPSNKVITRHLSSRGAYEINFMYAAHRRANDSGA